MNTLSFTFPDYSGAIKAALTPVYERLVLEVQEKQIESIQARTSKGLDADNNTFEGYKPSTLAHKRRTKKQQSPVNLRQTDLMMNNLYARKETDYLAIVGFNDKTYQGRKTPPTVLEVASYHDTGTKFMAQRQFLGYSPQDIADYSKLFETETVKAVNEALHV